MQAWLGVGVGVLVALTLGVTILAAYLLWRDGYRRGWITARNAPPKCPRCGYNLSGLTQCRCPECGSQYTMDQLWNSPAVPKTHAAAKSDKGT